MFRPLGLHHSYNKVTIEILSVLSVSSVLCLSYLDPLRYTSAVHAAGNVDGIPPDIILGLPGPDHSSHHWTHVQTWSRWTGIWFSMF